jgi:hypothetical protein
VYIGAKAVQPLAAFQLLITFENGEQRVLSLEPYLDKGVFRELRDSKLFDTVRISFDTVEWANGADLCPETLYADSVPVETEAFSNQNGQ